MGEKVGIVCSCNRDVGKMQLYTGLSCTVIDSFIGLMHIMIVFDIPITCFHIILFFICLHISYGLVPMGSLHFLFSSSKQTIEFI